MRVAKRVLEERDHWARPGGAAGPAGARAGGETEMVALAAVDGMIAAMP
jgi:hypothetical protein